LQTNFVQTEWENAIKTDLTGIGCEGDGHIQLAQGMVQWQALVDVVMNLYIP
jgi:hypothetical protein